MTRKELLLKTDAKTQYLYVNQPLLAEHRDGRPIKNMDLTAELTYIDENGNPKTVSTKIESLEIIHHNPRYTQ